MSTLVALAGSEPGRRYSLEGPECVVGRRLDCHVTIQDQRVSRRHARFYRVAGGVFVEDLGSVNGTFVNGRRVATPARLSDGDQVAIGSARFRVELGTGSDESSEGSRITLTGDTALSDALVEVANLRQRDALLRAGAPAVDADPLRELERVQNKLRTMYRVGEAVAANLEPRALLGHAVDELLSVFSQARAASALLLDPRTQDLRVAVQRVRPGAPFCANTALPRKLFERVVRHGHAVLLRGADDRSSDPGGAVSPLAAGWQMSAPLSYQGEALGVLHIDADPSGVPFTQADLDLLGGIAAQAGVALHVARLHEKVLERDRLDKDLAIARQIQRNLLPREPPRLSGLEFAVHYEPAFEVGGDFFDFLWLGPRRLALLIGDVSGKAVSGALFMARVTSEFRALAPLESNPRRLLQRVNRAVAEVADDGMFCTAVLLSIDLSDHTARYSSAGHTAPLLRRGTTVVPLDERAARTTPLGLAPRIEVGEGVVRLRAGDALLLYTDGLLEARSPSGAFYGAERLAEVFARTRGAARSAVDVLLADLDAFVHDAPQSDDQTIVCVGVTRASSRRMPASTAAAKRR